MLKKLHPFSSRLLSLSRIQRHRQKWVTLVTLNYLQLTFHLFWYSLTIMKLFFFFFLSYEIDLLPNIIFSGKLTCLWEKECKINWQQIVQKKICNYNVKCTDWTYIH